MTLTCIVPNVKVLTKRVFESTNKQTGEVKTYYQLGCIINGEIGEVGCELPVYQGVITDKSYDMTFKYNTRFDKNFIRFDTFKEASSDISSKK